MMRLHQLRRIRSPFVRSVSGQTYDIASWSVFITRRHSSAASKVGVDDATERFKTKSLLRSSSISEPMHSQAIEYMTFWAGKQTDEGTELSWSLLDFLVENRVEISTQTLNQVVKGWTQQPAKLRPMGVLQRLEEYQASVQTDVHTYQMILETAEQFGGQDLESTAKCIHKTLEGVPGDAETLNTIKERITFLQSSEWRISRQCDITEPHDMSRPRRLSPIELEEQLLESSQGKELMNRDFNKMLQAWVNSDENPDVTAARCLEILRHMQELYREGHGMAIPTQITYSLVITALARTGRARDAESLLKELLDEFAENNDELQKPNNMHFTAVIDAWAKSGSKEAPKRAWNLLMRMDRMALETDNSELVPSAITYNAVLNSMAQSSARDPRAGSAAQALLAKMWTRYEEGNVHAKPDLVTYNTILNALADSGNVGSAEEAMQVLQSMHSRYREGDRDVKPDLVCYNTVLKAWRNSGTPDAPDRATALLDEMERLASSEEFDTTPDQTTYITLINIWSRSRRPEGYLRIKALLKNGTNVGVSGETKIYNAYLDGLARFGYLQEAHDMLDELCMDYLEGRSSIKPDLFTFNTMIAAYRGNSVKAESVFNDLKNSGPALELQPDVISFTALITSFVNCGDTKKAEKYFNEVRALYATTSDKSLQPDRKLYATMLKTLKFNGDPLSINKGFALLEDLKALHIAGVPNCSPDHFVYNTLLDVISASPTLDKVERAQQIVHEMDKNNIMINKFTLDSVLLSCSRLAGEMRATGPMREHAFSVAFHVFHRLLKEYQPEPRMFHLFFRVTAGLENHAKEIEEAELLFKKFGFGQKRSFRQSKELT